MNMIDILAQGTLLGGFYALFAIGLSLSFGIMRLVNIAHGDFIVLSAYLTMVAADGLGLSPLLALGLVLPVMFGLGLALQAGLLNRTLKAGFLPPILVTFGLSVILQNGLLTVFGAGEHRLQAGALETASLSLGPVTLGLFPLVVLGVAVLVIAGLQGLFTRTQIGRAFRAVSDDPATARLIGIDDRWLYALALGLAMAVTALAGMLFGIRTIFAPMEGPARLIFAFEAVIIGGLGNLWGTLAGGVILGLAQAFGARLDPNWQILAGNLVFILLLILRPSGLFPRTRD
jgi:branched-chain amino acid transport system permease protein